MSDDLLKAMRALFARGGGTEDERTLVAALESDRALLRRIVEAYYNGTGIAELIDEARARIGEGMLIRLTHFE